MFVPPSLILAFCIMMICLCQGHMYHAALKVTMVLRCSNRRAHCTVGFYLFMFLLKLRPHVFFIVLTLKGVSRAFSSSCMSFRSLLTALLIIISMCISAAVLLVHNPQVKQLLFATCQQQCQLGRESKMEAPHNRGDDRLVMDNCELVDGRQSPPPPPLPLPGSTYPSLSEGCELSVGFLQCIQVCTCIQIYACAPSLE